MDWKEDAIAAYNAQTEKFAAEEAERKVRAEVRAEESARSEMIDGLTKLGIPVEGLEVRLESFEDSDRVIPYAVIDGIEFTLSRGGGYGGNKYGGIARMVDCPRCQGRLRGRYIWSKEVLGNELVEPEITEHTCRTEEDRLLASQVREVDPPDSPEHRLCDAIRDMIAEATYHEE